MAFLLEAIVKYQDTEGNQYNLTPTPQDVFALNGISFISGIQSEVISCAIDVEGVQMITILNIVQMLQ